MHFYVASDSVSNSLDSSSEFEPMLACMSTEDNSASRVLMPVKQGEFPSKLYLPQAVANSLLGAASALLALNSRLKLTLTHDNLELLQEDLKAEIHAFESQAYAQGYTTQTIVLSRYALCALLDETISQMVWGQDWLVHYALLQHFHGEADADERFFSILQRLCDQPERSVDVLELLYCCLSQGYEGQFKIKIGSKQQQDSLLEQVYQRISQVRTAEPLWQPPPQPKQPSKRAMQMTLPKVLVTTGLVLCLMYGAFQYLLQVTTQPIDQILLSINDHVQTA